MITTALTTTNSALPGIGITVQEALAQVSLEVGAVAKDQQMAAGPARYSYRGIDSLLSAVHGPLARNNVTFSPESIQIISEDKGTTRSGSASHHVRAVVTFRIYGPSGDSITAAVLAEAADTSDKASSKLMSQAFKYALGEVLAIPYTLDDQDAERPEPIEIPRSSMPSSPESILANIQNAAKLLDKTVPEVTNKIREQHGGLGPDELLEIPLPALAEFAAQLSNYATKNRSK